MKGTAEIAVRVQVVAPQQGEWWGVRPFRRRWSRTLGRRLTGETRGRLNCTLPRTAAPTARLPTIDRGNSDDHYGETG